MFSNYQVFNIIKSKVFKMEEQFKNKKAILKDIKFVGVTFGPDSFKKGENELNKAIEMGYKVITDYPTSTGVVFSVGLYKSAESEK